MQSLIDRFWSRVQKTDGCWLWTGCACKGYGQLAVGARLRAYAHRFAWELNYGPISFGMCVLHRCDTPLCVRPDHLFLGTNKDNMADKVAKGRQLKGAEAYAAKLTEAQVRRIRSFGESAKSLAAQFGVDESTIFHIRARRIWRHLP